MLGRWISRRKSTRNLSTLPNPTILNKRNAIFLLKNCESIPHLKQIQAQLFRVGLHQDKDTLIKLMAFVSDPSKGNLNHANEIFTSIESPCLLMYNLMLRAFVKGRKYKEGLVLFGELRGEGLWPDNFTYPFVFKAIGCLGEGLEGEKVHGFVVKTGLVFDSYVCNSLMDMYGHVGRVRHVRKVFDEMSERDLVSWNVLISVYVKCGWFEEAVDVFCWMRKVTCFEPGEATVVSTLVACAAMKRLDLGKELHSYVVDKRCFTPIVVNALLDMYCKCGCLSIAREIFEDIPCKNVICWTTMVSGYVNCGKLDEARELFERSPVKDVVLWTAMLNGYVQFNRFGEALALFGEMQQRGITPDNHVLVSLLTCCAQMGAVEQGKWIHGYITDKRIPMDKVIGTALVGMYAKCGCVVEALEVFYGVRQRDTALWTSIICGLAMNGSTSKALKLFSAMKQVGIRPDDITFIGVLSACSHGGLVEEGLNIFDSMMTTHKIEPKLEHYGCLIDLCGRAGRLDKAEELIKKIPLENNKMIVSLYGALLSACRTYGNVRLGEQVGERLAKIEFCDSSIHTLLANIYASADRWDDVTKVRKKMKKLGVRKVPGCSSIEVNGIVHEFIVGDPSHPDMANMYFMLEGVATALGDFRRNNFQKEDIITASF